MDIPPRHSLPEETPRVKLPFEPHNLLPFPTGEGIWSGGGKERVGLVIYSRLLGDQVQFTYLLVRMPNTLPVQTDPTPLRGQQGPD